MADIDKSIGLRLKEERVRLEWKSKELAEEMNIHHITQSYYEKGRRNLPITILAPLKNLGFDIQYILFGERGRQDSQYEESTLASEVDNLFEGDLSATCISERIINKSVYLEKCGNITVRAMYDIETTFRENGLEAGIDYDRKTLLTAALTLLKFEKQPNGKGLTLKNRR